jgi:hypothetical protein
MHTPTSAAKAAGVARSTIYRAIKTGRLAAHKLQGYDSPQAAGIEKRVNKENTGKPAGRLRPIPRTAKPTLQRHARAIIRVVLMFLFPLASRVGRKCLQPLERL